MAIHAVELYLNALLRHRGHSSEHVRGLQHDLRRRIYLAQEKGLLLRHRTAEHLLKLSETREYLVARYDPRTMDQASQLNRLAAPLEEVALKVSLEMRSVG